MKALQRSVFLDLLKGVAIISVILYHCGLFTFGYLGVEIFFVVGGYLITKSLMRNFNSGNFGYWHYLTKRLVRLWPLLIIVSGLSLFLAYLLMLPDNMKNVGETAVGTVTFTNNIVQYITSGNYWDQSNDFKPLMHTWYIAIMMQCYVVYPFILLLDYKCSRVLGRGGVIAIVCLLSIVLFFLPCISDGFKFYQMSTRLFEFCIGGLVSLGGGKNKRSYTFPILVFSIFVLLLINQEFSGKELRLLITVACVTLLLVKYESDGEIRLVEDRLRGNIIVKTVVNLGMMSYSLYLWHQVILAFYRYCFTYSFSWVDYIICIVFSVIIGRLSYTVIEKKLMVWQKGTKVRRESFVVSSVILAFAVVVCGAFVFRENGIVRDFPELDIDSSVSTVMPQEYNGSVGLKYDHAFTSDVMKRKLLVVGDSYGRDWLNILIESGKVEHFDISYHKEIDSVLWYRSREADIIFLANNADYTMYSDLLPLWLSKSFWRVGCKDFGKSMGPSYCMIRRGETPFYTMPSDEIMQHNRERKVFGDRYIDIMEALRRRDGRIPLSTPNGKLISHDGLHLTRNGAKYLACLMRNDIKAFLK